jgi:hypothetical protein
MESKDVKSVVLPPAGSPVAAPTKMIDTKEVVQVPAVDSAWTLLAEHEVALIMTWVSGPSSLGS